jgi:acyl-CoA synthetase (AMP-forming)/AMP-acid ligase II
MVLERSDRYGELEALVDGDRRWSYRELGLAVRQAVRAAVASGIQQGERIGLWAPNSADWIFAALGILGAGGILVPLNTRWKGQEVAYALDRAGATGLFIAQGFLGADQVGGLRAASPELPALERIVLLAGEAAGALPWEQHLQLGDSVPDDVVDSRIAAIKPEDIADLMFTSGTTGLPKGVPLRHETSIRAHVALTTAYTFHKGDRYLVIPPFFHTFGYKAGWMASFFHGVAVIPQAVFDAEDVLRKIEAERISILLGPPTVFSDLMSHPGRQAYDLSSLRVTMASAATVPVELIHQLRKDMGFEVVLTSYGLTEAHSAVSTSRVEDAPEDIARSVGRPLDGVEVAIADDEGRLMPAGERGEVLVRGYVVMDGYWEDPAATAEVIDADGWLHTGDIGVVDEQGFLSIVDRKKDMVVVGGFNVYPAEVERVLLQHADVAEAAVVGRPDDRLGEVPVAFVVSRQGTEVDPAEIKRWMREHVANVKVPREVQVVDALPRNASLKVQKGELRRLLID